VSISQDPVQSFTLLIGGDAAAVGFVADLLDRLAVQAIDPQTESGIFDVDSATTSLEVWRRYRDHAIGGQ